MYKFKKLTIIVFVVLFLLNSNLSAYAVLNGFSTETLSSKETSKILSSLEINEIKEEPTQKSIDCFDVNEKGNIVIGTSNSDKKEVIIYNSANEFVKGYEFFDSGSFGVEWNEDKINIYLVRGDLAVTINEKGNVDNIVKIENTIDNNSYWNNSVFSPIRFVGEQKYVLRDNLGFFSIFSSSYSQLVRIDENDYETILYDVSHENLIYSFIILLGVVIFIAIIFSIIIHRLKIKNW